MAVLILEFLGKDGEVKEVSDIRGMQLSALGVDDECLFYSIAGWGMV